MLIIFDKDSTLVASIEGRPANTIEEHSLLPGVLEKCQQLKADGHVLAVASNQGGVAFGYVTYKQMQTVMLYVAELIGADYAIFCPYHPKGTVKKYARESLHRKPNPGMLLTLARRAKVDDPTQILFVGDLDTDKEAAERAGIGFAWAAEFFSSP